MMSDNSYYIISGSIESAQSYFVVRAKVVTNKLCCTPLYFFQKNNVFKALDRHHDEQ